MASLSTVLLWGGPSYLAGIWFPSSQRGIAAAAGGALAPQVCMYEHYNSTQTMFLFVPIRFFTDWGSNRFCIQSTFGTQQTHKCHLQWRHIS